MLFFLFADPCGAVANEPVVVATNVLLAGVRPGLNLLLPSAIKKAGFDPYESESEQQIEGLLSKVCKEGTINGNLNVTGLGSTQISDMKVASVSSNFLRTRVDAPMSITAVVENGLTIGRDGEFSARCFLRTSQAEVRTVSHIKGVSIRANVTLNTNLATSTFKSAIVDSVFLTFSEVETSCDITIGSSDFDGLESLCPAVAERMTPYLRSYVEGPLSAKVKLALQKTLDSKLPFGPGAVLAANTPHPTGEPRRLSVEEIPVLDEIDVLV